MPSAEPSLAAVADVVVGEVLRRPAGFGGGPTDGGRLLAIDGRSGSGKSSLARAVLARLGPELAFLLEVERLYPGWSGLADGVRVLAAALAPLTGRPRRPGVAPTWDWHADAPGASLTIPVTPVLVVEGVGAGTLALAAHRTLLVWTTAPDAVRRSRALTRDGGSYAPHWDAWAEQEERYFAADPTLPDADLVVAEGTILRR